MAKKKQAIKPGKSFSGIPAFIKEKEVEVKGISDEEKKLASMAQTSGWYILKGFINEVIENLNDLNETAISQGAGLKEIGQNTVVINLAKGVIKKIVDKVEDAKEACETVGEKAGK